MPFRVLVVEDDEDLARGLQTALEVEGYEVRVVPGLDATRQIYDVRRRIEPLAEPAPPVYEPRVRFSDVEVDLEAHVVHRAGRRVDLSPRTFDLLAALVNRRGRVVRRADLLRDVWGHQFAIATRTVDVHMLTLRRKLERDPASPAHFLTVRKAGYRFQP
jgi:two-component system, OmpR family, KDP operon response regulator KdpE